MMNVTHPARLAQDQRLESAPESKPWHGRSGLISALAMVAVFGGLSALLTPRGPITGRDALITMTLALLVGVGVGVGAANRWALVWAPLVFIAVFEIGRISAVGPTVDLPRLGSLYGVIALTLGRGVHALFALLPMIVGIGIGVGVVRRPQAGRKWIGPILGIFALVGIAIFTLRPASTAPISGPDGEPLPGSVAELTAVDVNGSQQALMIRGADVTDPVLLYIAGGPGGTDLGALRGDTALERDFVVVGWDQRGTGKSYSGIQESDALNVDQYVSDLIVVTEYLRERFDEEKVYLVGNSWGTVLGTLAVQRHPDLFHAYVGVGQMVSLRETDIMFWEDTLAWAEDTGNTDLAAELRSNGPPPYSDIDAYEPVVSHEHDWNPYPGFDASNEMPAILFVPEYTVLDRINAFRGFLDTNAVVYDQLQGIDFRRDVTSLDVPVYLVQGEHEARGRSVLAEQWFEMLDAPAKGWETIEGAGHRPHFDDPATFTTTMRKLKETTYEN